MRHDDARQRPSRERGVHGALPISFPLELYDRFNYLRGYLWSGRRSKFKESFDRLLRLLDRVRDEVSESKRSACIAIAHLCDLQAYLQKNASGIISYREWRNAGKRISTSAVEGTVNRLIGRRMCKSQYMCWSKRGALFFSKCGAQSSTATYLPAVVAGFRPSGSVESCCRGIGYPSNRNGSSRHSR
jgi:hypothetical protein